MGNKSGKNRHKSIPNSDGSGTGPESNAEGDFSAYYTMPSRKSHGNSPRKTMSRKSTKYTDENYAELLLAEVAKDIRCIDLKQCEDYIDQCSGGDIENQIDKYSETNALHYVCAHGHIELVEAIIMKAPRLVTHCDINGSTPFHALCNNTTSLDGTLMNIFQMLRVHKVELETLNNDNETGIDLLINRIQHKNPYDDNLGSIKLLYCHILD